MTHQNQTGSALVAALIVLVVALAAGLGWVLYQNYANPAANTASESTTMKSDVTAQTDSKEEVLDLVISEYEVGGTYDTDEDTLTYSAKNEMVTLFSSQLANGECDGNVGVISVYAADDEVADGVGSTPEKAQAYFEARQEKDWAKVKNTYYAYTPPQALCGSNDADTTNQATERARSFVVSLKDA